MVPIARRNLLADKTKLLVALGGVTLAIVLILVVQSLYQGVRRESASFIHDLPADVWIAQEGATDLVFSNSHLPASAAADIRAVQGVDAVYALYGRLMSFQLDDGEFRAYVMAIDPLADGTNPDTRPFIPHPGAIVIDRASANQSHLSRGDVLTFNGRTLTVAAVRRVGNILVTQFAFIAAQDFRELFGVPGAVNFFLVSLADGVSPADVMGPLSLQVEGSTVFTTDEFARSASRSVTNDFLPIIRVITVISFIVGLAVLSLTIYSATIERAREYAVMKVLGASPLRLYRIVFSQSTFIAALGFAAGVGLAFLFNRLAADLVPQFITYIRWRDVVLVLGVAAVMSFIASYMPVNRVARVDPASVFRA